MESQNDIVIGLGFGDEGKGTVTDYLCTLKPVNAVVRFSGGAQTAHNVVLENGQHHTFAQFGSGTMRGVQTLLSKYMMVNPFTMAAEANALIPKIGYDPFDITLVSSTALLTTPLHAAVNHLREIARGGDAHGSCGMGIGETRSYALKHPILAVEVNDLRLPGYLEAKLDEYRKWAENTFGVENFVAPSTDELMVSYMSLMADNRLRIVSDRDIREEIRKGYNVFEGSQGVLLDEAMGFHPHTTWSDTTSQKAQRLLAEAGLPQGNVIGVTRSYTTRHGYGPFPSEFIGEAWRESFPEEHNGAGRWQGSWRGGYLDLPLLKYAVKANHGVDEIAVTHLDTPVEKVVTGYHGLGDMIPASNKNLIYQEALTKNLERAKGKYFLSEVSTEDALIEKIEKATNAPVGIKSYGTRSDQKVGR